MQTIQREQKSKNKDSCSPFRENIIFYSDFFFSSLSLSYVEATITFKQTEKSEVKRSDKLKKCEGRYNRNEHAIPQPATMRKAQSHLDFI